MYSVQNWQRYALDENFFVYAYDWKITSGSCSIWFFGPGIAAKNIVVPIYKSQRQYLGARPF